MVGMHDDTELRNLAARQHCLVAKRQAFALGYASDDLIHRLERGEWKPYSSRVLILSGTPILDNQRLMGALLHVGDDAYFSHDTALALWGLPGFDLTEIHLIRPRPGRTQRTSVAIVHTSRDLPDDHLARTPLGMPVTTPVRAIFDIAGTAHPKRVERALDHAWSRRLLTIRSVEHMLARLAKKGRPGIELMRTLYEARLGVVRPPESNTEARLNELLVRDGQRPLTPQVDVGGEEWIGRIDLADLPIKFLVEVQSDLYHGSLVDQHRDAERLAALQAAGWYVLEVFERDIWYRPRPVLQQIRQIREDRQRRVA